MRRLSGAPMGAKGMSAASPSASQTGEYRADALRAAGARVLGFNYDTGERYLSVADFLPVEG